MNLAAAVVVVTGASSGIGRAVALELAADGIKLVVCARRVDRLERIADEATARNAATEVLALPCNLRDETDIHAMFGRIRARWGGVDILVNNAGLGRQASLLEGASDDWREMLDVNVLALCICTREAVSDMRRRDVAGHVVHVSSMAGHRTPLESGIYSATKYAVRALTEGLRRELREHDSPIRVSAVSPGFVETEFAQVYAHGDEAALERTYGRYAVLQPEDIASTIRFVLTAPPHMQVHDVLVRPTQQRD